MDKTRLPFLLQQQAENKLTELQLQELSQLLTAHPQDHVLQTIAELMEQESKNILPVSHDLKLTTFNKVIASDLHQAGSLTTDFRSDTVSSTHRIHFLKTTWFRYAAAIILMLGVGAYLWFNNTTSFPPNPNYSVNTDSDIQPGSDKAILTLANGQQIILDSTQGDIVKKANLTVVNLAGKLKYEGVGTGDEYNTISTPKGGQYQVLLPDGSKVWLNAMSSIKFPTAFTGTVRNVEMTGEVYMEIAGNSKQSFIVRAGGVEVKVLGTSFNVNAYSNESVLKTTLIDGRIKIKTVKEETILQPGQQAEVANNQSVKINNDANIEKVMAWKNGIFNFDGVDLYTTMRQLERWYGIEVVYEGAVPNIRFFGKMSKNLSLAIVLEGLKGAGVHFRMAEGKKLIVVP